MRDDGRRSCIHLTARESEVLNALASGMSSKEMAKGMSITPRTVEVYIERLKSKLDARNRVHAAAIGVGLGLVSLWSPGSPA